MNIVIHFWVDGGVKQRQEHVTKQLFKAGHHLVFTIHIAEYRQQTTIITSILSMFYHYISAADFND